MVARRWGVLPVHLAYSKQQGHAPTPSPAGDREGHPSGPSGLRPVFMASVDAYWASVRDASTFYLVE